MNYLFLKYSTPLMRSTILYLYGRKKVEEYANKETKSNQTVLNNKILCNLTKKSTNFESLIVRTKRLIDSLNFFLKFQ